MAMGEVFISRRSCKSVKAMTSFTFSKAVQHPGMESFPGRFWPPGLTFDISGLNPFTRSLADCVIVQVTGLVWNGFSA